MIIKVLKFLGALVYGAIMYYLLWLLFYWVTPHVMGLSWGWFAVYLCITGGIVTGFVSSVALWLVIPLTFLCRKCKAAKYAPIIFGLLYGYSAVRLPWMLDMKYGMLQWTLGISHTITIVVTFIAMMRAPFVLNEDEDEYEYDN